MTPTEIKLLLRKAAEQFGYTELSRLTGIPRPHIYQALKGNPTLKTLFKIVENLGYRISIEEAK